MRLVCIWQTVLLFCMMSRYMLHGLGRTSLMTIRSIKSAVPCTMVPAATRNMESCSWVMRFDGGSRGNPGLGGAGAVIYSCEDNKLNEVWCGYFFCGPTAVTNNVAEYEGLIQGLKQCAAMKIQNVLVQGDSELILRQVQRIYKVRQPHLQLLFQKVNKLLRKVPGTSFKHIYREENARADELSNNAMDTTSSFSCYHNFEECEALLKKHRSNFPPLKDMKPKQKRVRKTAAALPKEEVIDTSNAIREEAVVVVDKELKTGQPL